MTSIDCLKLLDELHQTLKPPYKQALHFAIQCMELMAAACHDEDLIPKLEREEREGEAILRRREFRVYDGGDQ